MKQIHLALLIASILLAVFGCQNESAEKIRSGMEKLVYDADRLAERLNLQPQLANSADSAQLKDAFAIILDYYFARRDFPSVRQDEKAQTEMAGMAVLAQVRLARFYARENKFDSVLAAYGRIGAEIPATAEERAGAIMARALVFRALGRIDSTLELYDRLLTAYYPPLDSSGRINADLVSLPIDRIRLAETGSDRRKFDVAVGSALAYYEGLIGDPADNSALAKTARSFRGRVYAMTKQWDKAIRELAKVRDSAGQIDIRALMIMADICNGPKKELARAADMYREIIDRRPDSGTLGTAMLRLGANLCAQKNHSDGRAVLSELKEKFSRSASLAAPAQYYYAVSFDRENKWTRALSELQWLMDNFPYTEDAFQAAHYIVDHYDGAGDGKSATRWRGRAEELYRSAVMHNAGKPIALIAQSYLAESYLSRGEGDKALAVYEQIAAAAPRSRPAARALYSAAMAAMKALGDSVRAQLYLDRLNREFGTADSAAIHSGENLNLNLESIH